MDHYTFLGKLPTYPSPKPTLTLTSHLGQNVGIGEGRWAVSQKRIIIQIFGNFGSYFFISFHQISFKLGNFINFKELFSEVSTAFPYFVHVRSRKLLLIIIVFLLLLSFFRRYSSRLIFPYGLTYYVNLCTVDHDNSSCTSRDRISGKRVPLPVMACRSSWYNDVSIGSVIGYKRKPDIRSGLIVELLHGDKCFSGGECSQRVVNKL